MAIAQQSRLRQQPGLPELDAQIEAATDALLALARDDGHWCFELEADATIPAEYVLLTHFRGETPDLALEAQDRRLSPAHPGRPRRLAPVPRWRLRHERQRQGLLRA